MPKNWSDSPFPKAVPAAEVSGQAQVISTTGGESLMIYEIDGHPGWVAKRYAIPVSTQREEALKKLIALPGMMSPQDLSVVDASTTWPVARIIDGGLTAGVIFAKAPDHFFSDLIVTAEVTRHVATSVDHLAQSNVHQERLGILAPTLQQRLAAARGIVAVGDLFERHSLVYGDWSYSNALWSPGTSQVLVIDIDSCGFTTRPWVESNAWDDPLVEPGLPLTTYTDRYKLALLTVRCITGVRADGLTALADLPDVLRGSVIDQLIHESMSASRRTTRPSLPELLWALDQALGKHEPGRTPPTVSRPAAPVAPAATAAPAASEPPPPTISMPTAESAITVSGGYFASAGATRSQIPTWRPTSAGTPIRAPDRSRRPAARLVRYLTLGTAVTPARILVAAIALVLAAMIGLILSLVL